MNRKPIDSKPDADFVTRTWYTFGRDRRTCRARHLFNEESVLAVLQVKVRGHRDQVTVLGSLPSISAAEWLTGTGRWIRGKEHGRYRAKAPGADRQCIAGGLCGSARSCFSRIDTESVPGEPSAYSKNKGI
jgi:hypothetical protein